MLILNGIMNTSNYAFNNSQIIIFNLVPLVRLMSQKLKSLILKRSRDHLTVSLGGSSCKSSSYSVECL